ncbi:SRPBCC domain-containing protein [Streptosporangiaceae bacterium NEAU-GS5]|nr:SRPBCC domain-containing protein [Streptosporangiaceae bacterium NEAU-GS5]
MAPIRLSADYPYPVESVWEALTDPVALREWFTDNDFKPIEGHEFTLRMPPRPGFDGVVNCRVLRVDPPRLLSYSWTGGWLKQPTTVTWTLTATPGGTHLELEHDGLEQGVLGRLLKVMLRGGWGGMLRKALPRTVARRRGQKDA